MLRLAMRHSWLVGPVLPVTAGNETGKTTTPQLYDLAADPGEKNNLAAEPAQAGRIAEMGAVLARERARTGPEK